MIIAVAGFTRSGTSLMMRMLDAAGIPIFADDRAAYESTQVGESLHDPAWLASVDGHAFKLIDPIHHYPIPKANWRFILMRRDVVEQAKSAVKFLKLVQGLDLPPHAVKVLSRKYQNDYPRMRSILAGRGRVLDVRFEDVLAEPTLTAAKVLAFIGQPADYWNNVADNARITRMAEQVIRRSPTCYDGLLEIDVLKREGDLIDPNDPADQRVAQFLAEEKAMAADPSFYQVPL